MAAQAFNPAEYDPVNLIICMNRKHGRAWIDTIMLPGFFVDLPVASFVSWCQANGTKLQTIVPGSSYEPDFRDDEAMELFRATWMTEHHLIEYARARRPNVRAEAA